MPTITAIYQPTMSSVLDYTAWVILTHWPTYWAMAN